MATVTPGSAVVQSLLTTAERRQSRASLSLMKSNFKYVSYVLQIQFKIEHLNKMHKIDLCDFEAKVTLEQTKQQQLYHGSLDHILSAVTRLYL